jgi:hypothetical protein
MTELTDEQLAPVLSRASLAAMGDGGLSMTNAVRATVAYVAAHPEVIGATREDAHRITTTKGDRWHVPADQPIAEFLTHDPVHRYVLPWVESPERCPSCRDGELQEGTHTAPGFVGLEFTHCPECGWRSEP